MIKSIAVNSKTKNLINPELKKEWFNIRYIIVYITGYRNLEQMKAIILYYKKMVEMYHYNNLALRPQEDQHNLLKARNFKSFDWLDVNLKYFDSYFENYYYFMIN